MGPLLLKMSSIRKNKFQKASFGLDIFSFVISVVLEKRQYNVWRFGCQA